MKRKTYTTKDLFDIVMAELSARDQVPDILDYALAAWNPKPVLDYGFDVLGCVNYGGSEGIYIDLFYSGDIGNGVEKGEIGTIKTLSRSDEAFLAMAELMARFQIEATRFINNNLDDFTHVGYVSTLTVRKSSITVSPTNARRDWMKPRRTPIIISEWQNRITTITSSSQRMRPAKKSPSKEQTCRKRTKRIRKEYHHVHLRVQNPASGSRHIRDGTDKGIQDRWSAAV